jgi:hypothetical protein
MFYFYEQDGKLIANANYKSIPEDQKMIARSRWDYTGMADVEAIANRLNEEAGKTLYIAIDSGAHVSPRWDVIELPQVGDEVSYSFNGDTYPCGTITKITPKLQIVTSDGKRFTFKNGGWRYNGTWWLVKGHHHEQNPHF